MNIILGNAAELLMQQPDWTRSKTISHKKGDCEIHQLELSFQYICPLVRGGHQGTGLLNEGVRSIIITSDVLTGS